MSEPGDLDPAPQPDRPRRRRRRKLPALPVPMRIVVLVVGWIVVLIGIAGLALPGIQGCLTIAAGAALLSLASEMIYRGLRRLLIRWPKVLDRVEHFRGWVHDRISRRREP
jgi:sulfite exporter TauE/SafE